MLAKLFWLVIMMYVFYFYIQHFKRYSRISFFYVLIIKQSQNKAMFSLWSDLILNESNNAYCLKLNITRGIILFNYL